MRSLLLCSAPLLFAALPAIGAEPLVDCRDGRFQLKNTVGSLMGWSDHAEMELSRARAPAARKRACDDLLGQRGSAHCRAPDDAAIRGKLQRALELCGEAAKKPAAPPAPGPTTAPSPLGDAERPPIDHHRRATPKLPARVFVGAPNTPPGQRLAAGAVLMDPRGRALHRQSVTITVRHPDTGAVYRRCTARTNAHGEAQCVARIPRSFDAASVSVEARFEGSDAWAPASSSARVSVQNPLYSGSLLGPGATTVQMGDPLLSNTGSPTVFQARVSKDGARVTSGHVWFHANGQRLGSARVDSHGWARATLRVRRGDLAQLKPITFRGSFPGYVGAIQAWYRPAAPRGEAPAALPGAAFVRSQWTALPAESSCVRAQAGPGSNNAPCTLAEGGSRTRIVRRGIVRVRQGSLGVDGTTPAPLRLAVRVPAPPDPPPDPSCDPTVGPSGVCHRNCLLVDYYVLADDGTVSSLHRADTCTSEAEFELDLPASVMREAYYRCDVEAGERPRWGHAATARASLGVLVAFRYNDPATHRTSGGWKVRKTFETKLVEATLRPSIDVECRR